MFKIYLHVLSVLESIAIYLVSYDSDCEFSYFKNLVLNFLGLIIFEGSSSISD
jgi:hypothetical protein